MSLFRFLLASVIFIAPTYAEVEHVQVNVNPLSEEEWKEIYAFQAALVTDEQDPEASEKRGDEIPLACGFFSQEAKSYYGSNVHPSASYNAVSIDQNGETIQLHDGSIWMIRPSDRALTFNWLITDKIVIAPKTSWFSNYNFRLINTATGDEVGAELDSKHGPTKNGDYTHTVLAIDISKKQICLDDHSVWEVAYFDLKTLQKWAPHETVMICINDGFFSLTRPNALYNVERNSIARVKCTY